MGAQPWEERSTSRALQATSEPAREGILQIFIERLQWARTNSGLDLSWN